MPGESLGEAYIEIKARIVQLKKDLAAAKAEAKAAGKEMEKSLEISPSTKGIDQFDRHISGLAVRRTREYQEGVLKRQKVDESEFNRQINRQQQFMAQSQRINREITTVTKNRYDEINQIAEASSNKRIQIEQAYNQRNAKFLAEREKQEKSMYKDRPLAGSYTGVSKEDAFAKMEVLRAKELKSTESQYRREVKAYETAQKEKSQTFDDYLNRRSASVNKEFDQQISSENRRVKQYQSNLSSMEREDQKRLNKQRQVYDENKRFLEDADDNANNFNATLARIQRTLIAIAAVVIARTLIEGFSKLISLGIEFNKELEISKIGIASILMAQGEFKSGMFSLEGVDKINASLEMSDKLINQLRGDNLKTIATFDQLVKIFQQTLAPALSSGFNVDQVRKFTLAMVQAGGALGVNLDMMAEETRSLLKGTITPRNTFIATALGITNEDIRRYKGDSQELFNFLMKKLEAFSIMGAKSQDTFVGAWSNLKDVVGLIAGSAASPFFESLKVTIKQITDSLMRVDKLTGEMKLNPQAVESFQFLYSVISKINDLLVITGGFFFSLGVIAKDSIKAITDSEKGLVDIYNNLGQRQSPSIVVSKPIVDLQKEIDARRKEINDVMELYKQYQSRIDELKSKPGLGLIDAIELTWTEGKLKDVNYTLEVLGVTTRTMDKETVQATGGLKNFSYAANIASISTEELEKRLKSIYKQFKEIEKGSEQLGNSLESQMISATERYLVASSKLPPAYAQLAIARDNSNKKLEKELELMKKAGASPGELEAYRMPKQYMIDYNYGTGFNAIKAEESRKDDKKPTFGMEDINQDLYRTKREFSKLYQDMTKMDNDYYVKKAQLSGDFWTEEKFKSEESILAQQFQYDDYLGSLTNKIQEMKDKLAKHPKSDPSLSGFIAEEEAKLNELLGQREKKLEDIRKKEEEILAISIAIKNAENGMNIASKKIEYAGMTYNWADEQLAQIELLEQEHKKNLIIYKDNEAMLEVLTNIYNMKMMIANSPGGDYAYGKVKEVVDPLKDMQRYIKNTQNMYDQIDKMREDSILSEAQAQAAKLDIWMKYNTQTLNTTSQFFTNLSSLFKANSAEAKALAIVAGTIDAILSSIKAYRSALDIPVIGAYVAPVFAAVAFAAQMAAVAKIQAQPSYAIGGYTGDLPKDRIVGAVHGQEFVTNANATRANRPALEAMNRGATYIPSNGGSTKAGAAGVNIKIENYGTSKDFNVQLSESEIRIIARDEAKGMVHKETDRVTANLLANPNSRTSKGLQDHTRTERRRSN